jgi:riboflavin synthase
VFTGIVEERGRVRSLEDGRLVVESGTVIVDAERGSSIAVNGVCLSVVERPNEALAFDLTPETLSRSTLGALVQGDPVNLERPVTLVTRLGGHLVQGHVDGVGEVAAIERGDEGGARMTIGAPREVGRYLVEKGSVCVDGVSLTVAAHNGSTFAVALIPHTLDATTLGAAEVGDPLNLEVDVIAKYVEAMLPADGGRR